MTLMTHSGISQGRKWRCLDGCGISFMKLKGCFAEHTADYITYK